MTENQRSFRLSLHHKRLLIGLTVIGGLALLLGLVFSPTYTAANLLLCSWYLLGIGLGALLFIALQYVVAAGWSVALRRVPEAMTAILPLAGLGSVVVLLLFPSLYSWTESSWQETAHHHMSFKAFWLNWPFFLARSLIYLGLWLLFAYAIVRTSRQQDYDADIAYTRRNVRLSAAFLVVFGITIWLSSYDWIMSLEPEWFSTIFGVYQFAGLFVGALAAMTCLLILLQILGPFRNILTREHRHDLGKLLFAFSTFWVYIWFCQYMLIWYVNNPEETFHYVRRQQGAWQPFFWLNLVLNWVIPFFVLLPRAAKQRVSVLWKVSILILIGRWVDLYLTIMPSIYGSHFPFQFWELALPFGAAGLFLLVFCRVLGSASLVPVNDPYLVESLHPNSETESELMDDAHDPQPDMRIVRHGEDKNVEIEM